MTTSLIVWMSTMTVSIALMVLSAAKNVPLVHMAVTAVIALVVALAAIQESRMLRAQGESNATIAASNARYMGLVWTWGAVSLFVTYNFILSWKEWFPFFMAFVVAAGLCLYFSATMNKDTASGESDPIMKKIGRYLTIAQVIGMSIAMVGLLLDGKMTRFAKVQRPGWEDWAANNIFFFGAFALVAIGLHALLADRQGSGDKAKA
jgi:hypothetical protein